MIAVDSILSFLNASQTNGAAQLYLLIFNLFAIFLVWLRIESRLSRLEGRFDQFLDNRKGGALLWPE